MTASPMLLLLKQSCHGKNQSVCEILSPCSWMNRTDRYNKDILYYGCSIPCFDRANESFGLNCYADEYCREERHVARTGYRIDCVRSCFSVDALVRLKAGGDLAAGNMTVGTELECLSKEGKPLSGPCVVRIFNRYDHGTDLINITTSDANHEAHTVSVTSNHFFLTNSGDYIQAVDLQVGQTLAGDGRNTTVTEVSSPYVGYAASILTDPPDALVLVEGGVFLPSFVSKVDNVSTLQQISMIMSSLRTLYTLCDANASLCHDVNNMTTHQMADFASNFTQAMAQCSDTASCSQALAAVPLPPTLQAHYDFSRLASGSTLSSCISSTPNRSVLDIFSSCLPLEVLSASAGECGALCAALIAVFAGAAAIVIVATVVRMSLKGRNVKRDGTQESGEHVRQSEPITLPSS